jgi:hypothetical protein
MKEGRAVIAFSAPILFHRKGHVMTIYRKSLFNGKWKVVDHFIIGAVGIRYIITNRI